MKQATRFDANNVIFLECDIQKIFSKHIMKYKVVLHNAKRLTRVAEVLKIPIVAIYIPRNYLSSTTKCYYNQ